MTKKNVNCETCKDNLNLSNKSFLEIIAEMGEEQECIHSYEANKKNQSKS